MPCSRKTCCKYFRHYLLKKDNYISDLKRAILEQINVPDDVKAVDLMLWSVNMKRRSLWNAIINPLKRRYRCVEVTKMIKDAFHEEQKRI